MLDDGGLLVVEMSPATGQISRISADGREKEVLAQTGRPNGLAMDRAGNIWVAETRQRALLRLAPDGRIDTVADACDGERFLFPNDVAVGPDGAIYMTDSGVLEDDLAPNGEVNPEWYKLPVDGRIFRIDPASREVTCLLSGIQFANGLAFSSDGQLFANETLTGEIFRIASQGRRIPFGNVVATPRAMEEVKGPDGMKFAADGRSFHAVFGQGDITVLAPDGTVESRIPVEGTHPTNLAFGQPGSGDLYVTEASTNTLQKIHVGVDGLPLYR